MMFGLKQRDMDLLQKLFAEFDTIEQVLIFGSRAKETHAPGADVDLAVKGKDITLDTLSRLCSALEDSPTPYFFDVVDYNTITNPALIDHIHRVGKVLYNKNQPSDR